LQRHLEAGGKARQGAAPDAEGGAGGGCPSVSPCLKARDYKGPSSDGDGDGAPLIAQPVPIQDGREIEKRQNGLGIGKPGDPAYTVDTTAAQAVAFTVDMQACKGNANVGNGTVSPTLCKPSGNDVHAIAIGTDCYNGAITGDVAATMGTPGSSVNASGPTVMQAVAFQLAGDRSDPTVSVSDAAFCLPANSMSDRGQAVAFHPLQDPISSTDGSTHCMGTGGSQGHASIAVAIAPALTATNDPSRSPQSSEVTQQVAAVYASTMTVRRLSAEECEALQGFSRGWTRIPWRKKPASECPDGPRYKALGNSMACNCMAWIGERIAAYEQTGRVAPAAAEAELMERGGSGTNEGGA
jgi:DNA (cytosine-5)-methyltransferase 1